MVPEVYQVFWAGMARGESVRQIAKQLGRSPSTVSRELRRNTDGLGRYRATTAHAWVMATVEEPVLVAVEQGHSPSSSTSSGSTISR